MKFRPVSLAVLMSAMAFMAAGCSQSGLQPNAGIQNVTAETLPAGQMAPATLTPLTAASGERVHLPDMAGAAGVKPAPITQAGADYAALADRLARLETAVAGLDAELKKTLPAFVKISAIQKEISDLAGALNAVDTAAGTPAAAVHEMPAPSHPPAAGVKTVGMTPVYDTRPAATDAKDKKPVVAAAATSAGPAAISGLRLGVNGKATRIVLDASQAVTFKTDLDNAEKLLIVELPKTGWTGNKTLANLKSPLVASASVDSDGADGHRLVIQLKENAVITGSTAMKPSGDKGHRVVIDITPAAS